MNLKNWCNHCQIEKKSKILHEVNDDKTHYESHYGSNFTVETTDRYYIMQCLTCDYIYFKKYEHCSEWVTADYTDNSNHILYPSPFKDENQATIEILRNEKFPKKLKNIFKESMTALSNNSFILAGAGFRLIIEGVCRDLNVGKENDKLAVLIDKLHNPAKLISRRDKERLHSIRFLGNDAIHELLRPTLSQLQLVLKIIYRIIEDQYLLDDKLSQSIDTIIQSYSDFIQMLNNQLLYKVHDKNYTLSSILGKTKRRLREDSSLKQMESKLLSEIKSGNYTKLKIMSESGKEVQYQLKK